MQRSRIPFEQHRVHGNPACPRDSADEGAGRTEYLEIRCIAPTGFCQDIPAGKRILLVPGQVGDDLSIRLGCSEIADNLSLLKVVRQRNPEAYILFRPHPDVDAGHRKGHVPDDIVLLYANEIQRGGSMTALIACVDEVHTMTSLAGFEALLRKRSVVTYGQPFYAGWGLTEDVAPPCQTWPPAITRRARGSYVNIISVLP